VLCPFVVGVQDVVKSRRSLLRQVLHHFFLAPGNSPNHFLSALGCHGLTNLLFQQLLRLKSLRCPGCGDRTLSETLPLRAQWQIAFQGVCRLLDSLPLFSSPSSLFSRTQHCDSFAKTPGGGYHSSISQIRHSKSPIKRSQRAIAVAEPSSATCRHSAINPTDAL